MSHKHKHSIVKEKHGIVDDESDEETGELDPPPALQTGTVATSDTVLPEEDLS